MGHKVGYRHRPHRGSLQFWHRSRASRQYPNMKWKENEEKGCSGFVAYKAGMTHAIYIENAKNSPNKGKKVFTPITILETPPVKVIGVRFYKKTPTGNKTITEILTRNTDKFLKKTIMIPKKDGKKFEEITGYDNLTLIIETQPNLLGIKKKPEILEIGLGGKLEDKIKYAKENYEKEISITQALKEGSQIDVSSVTKGKGVQGSVKRHGVMERNDKSDKVSRNVGAIGPTSPRKVSWKVPQYGQMGYQTRTEFNKLILKIGNNPKEINVLGGLKGYGLIKKDYIIIKGSIGGARKRMIILRKGIRTNENIPKVPPQIKYISQASNQGGRK